MRNHLVLLMLGIVITLTLATPPSSAQTPSTIEVRVANLEKEVADLKAALKTLNERLAQLETASTASPKSQPTVKPAPTAERIVGKWIVNKPGIKPRLIEIKQRGSGLVLIGDNRDTFDLTIDGNTLKIAGLPMSMGYQESSDTIVGFGGVYGRVR